MAGYNRSRYQYETSPRKLEPEYRTTQKKYPKKSTVSKNKSTKSKNKNKSKLQSKVKAIIYVGIFFAILFAISYRNTVISEKYSQIKSLKSNLEKKEKENEQLEVNIESKTNLGNVEKEAKDKLGMQKLDDKQTIYVELNKQDYVESAVEDIQLNKSEKFFQKIINCIKNIF